MDLSFAISARMARLIGMENFANAEGAIVELVKNAYDADAESCWVVVDIRNSKEESRIYIIDNGTGMSSETIKSHWMTIGTDDKLLNARSENKLRVKSGAKGIGRFALNKLGRRTEMITFESGSNGLGWFWTMDWSRFECSQVLSDVKATLDDVPLSFLSEKIKEYQLDGISSLQSLSWESFHGTILCISDLNDEWNIDALNSLLKNLEMLIPIHMKSIFGMYLINLQNSQWGGKVNPTEYEDYDYKVEAHYRGGKQIQVVLERNELNLSLLETQYKALFLRDAMKCEPYRIEDFRNRKVSVVSKISERVNADILDRVGYFDFTFYFLKNTLKDDRDKYGNKKYPYNSFDESRRVNWLNQFGGVRIYRDDFRVRPYGENGNDWLGLGHRQAKSPGGPGQKLGGYRIRPNQIAGVVNISRLTNTSFEDKSSREGIQENEAFVLFKNLLIQIIAEFEQDRNTIMYNLSELYKEEHPVMEQANVIANRIVAPNSNLHRLNDEEIKTLAESYKSLESELDDKEAELSMLRGLASLGISVGTFTHELRSVMLKLLPRNELLKNILLKYLSEQQFEGMRFNNPFRELEYMKSDDEKLHNWLMYSLHSIQRSKRDRTEISLASYFDRFIGSWRPMLQKKNITLNLATAGIGNALMDGFEMDLDSIFNNFMTNSINAFLSSKVESKRIDITLKNDHGFAVVDFVDNGVGLAKEYVDKPEVIFNAFETSTVDKQNNKIGTGMGLFIAKGIVNKYTDAMIALLPVADGFGIRTMFKLK